MRGEKEIEDKAEVGLEQWWVTPRTKLESLSLWKSLVFPAVSPSPGGPRRWLRGTAGAEVQQLLSSPFCVLGYYLSFKEGST